VTRLLILIKISLLLLLTACVPHHVYNQVHTKYDGDMRIVIMDPETIQTTWEQYTGRTTKVKGWARWAVNEETGEKWCQIFVPYVQPDLDMRVWHHEMRHCTEGHFHKGPYGYE
jgi:hypothetical protein